MPTFEEVFDPSNPATFLVAFAALWVFICVLLSMIGGWSRLAEDYRARCNGACRRWRFQSAAMRFGTSYSSCLTIGVHNDGLCLSVLFPFRVGHPPLLIPWTDLEKEGTASWWRGQRLRISKAHGVSLRVRGKLIERIEAARGQALRNVT